MDIYPFTGQYDVSEFTCGDIEDHADLNDFLKNDALRYATTSMSQTYVAVEDDIVVGYITLLMDAIWLHDEEKDKFKQAEIPPARTIPALKVGRLAKLSTYKKPLVGTALMRFAYATLLAQSEKVGCRLLSVDAIPSAVSFYEGLKFIPNLHPNHKGGKKNPPRTTSMRFDAFAPTLPDWTRKPPSFVVKEPADLAPLLPAS